MVWDVRASVFSGVDGDRILARHSGHFPGLCTVPYGTGTTPFRVRECRQVAVAVHAAKNSCTLFPDHTNGWQSLNVNDMKAVLRDQNGIYAPTPVVSPIPQHLL